MLSCCKSSPPDGGAAAESAARPTTRPGSPPSASSASRTLPSSQSLASRSFARLTSIFVQEDVPPRILGPRVEGAALPDPMVDAIPKPSGTLAMRLAAAIEQNRLDPVNAVLDRGIAVLEREGMNLWAMVARAVAFGDAPIVRALITAGFVRKGAVEVTERSNPLILAAALGRVDVLDLLAQEGVGLELEQQPTGRPREWTETALSVAAQHGQLVSVHALLRLGADPWHRVMWEGAPHRVDELVARCEGAELVREYLRLYGLRFQAFVSDATVDDILAGGGAVKIRARQLADVSRSLSLTRPHSRLGLTALHAAARVNDVPSITYLLTARVPVDVPDANGGSPLMTAIDFESFEAFEALRAAGASPAHVNARGLSVLRAAVVVGEMRMVRHLCDTDAFQRLTKAEIDALLETAARTEEEKPELGSAVDRGGVREGLRAMLRRLANELLNARTDAAIDAAHAGDKDRVFDAIDRMGVPILAKLTSERANGRTLLFAATEGGHADLIAGLLDRGALPTVAWTGVGGDNVLHVASQRGHAAVLRLLIEALPEVDRAALVDRPNEVEGMTPLLLACAAGHVACVRLLLDSGAAPRQRSMSQGATTLMLAARSGSLPCVQLLLERAKDDAPALMEELDRDENQVLGYAVRNRSWDVVRFFLAKGCRCLHRNRAGASILDLARDSAHPDIVPSILQARNREYDALAEKALREVRALVTRRRALPNAPGLADDPASVVAVDALARLLGEFPEVFVLAEPILAEARSLLFECDATEYSHNRVYKRAVELVLAGYKLFELELRHNEFVRACEERGDGGTHKLRQIEFLLSQPGVQLDGPRRRDGTTPLLAAIRGGAVLVAETLLRRGASADTACPFDGTTPLMRAASLARLEVIDLLLSAGARLELRDFEGKSALDWAADDETRTFLTRARRDERSALVRAG